MSFLVAEPGSFSLLSKEKHLGSSMAKLSCLQLRLGESGSLLTIHGLFSLLSKETHRGCSGVVIVEKSRRLPLRVDLGELGVCCCFGDTEDDC